MTISILSVIGMVFLFLGVSCDTSSPAAEIEYEIGDVGPAGGIIFYDLEDADDYYYDSGYAQMPEGTRYLEVSIENCGSGEGDGGADKTYQFGYSYDGDTKTTGPTSNSIGSGYANTSAIIDYTTKDAAEGDLTEYAAQAAAAYSYGGYDDWFLPTGTTLNLLYSHLVDDFNDAANLNTTSGEGYWASNVVDADNGIAGNCSFYGQVISPFPAKSAEYYVRAIRAF